MSVVRNMTANRASVEQGNYLVQAGVIPLLCNLLDSDEIPVPALYFPSSPCL